MSQNSPTESGSDHSSLPEYMPPDRPPVYTPQEYGEIFLDFYKFLATLHFDEAYLMVPPPEGWSFTPEFCSNLNKSDLVLQVLRYLPYFDRKCQTFIDYNCSIVDYPNNILGHFGDLQERDELGFESSRQEYEGEPQPMDIICFAEGFSDSGRMLYLNVRDGEVIEDIIRWMTVPPLDIKEFFNKLKDTYRGLKIIACPGRPIIEAGYADEKPRGTVITREQVLAQTEHWETKLDLQYIKQLYREYGWPGTFRKNAAFGAINELMELVQEKRGRYAWEMGPELEHQFR